MSIKEEFINDEDYYGSTSYTFQNVLKNEDEDPIGDDSWSKTVTKRTFVPGIIIYNLCIK